MRIIPFPGFSCGAYTALSTSVKLLFFRKPNFARAVFHSLHDEARLMPVNTGEEPFCVQYVYSSDNAPMMEPKLVNVRLRTLLQRSETLASPGSVTFEQGSLSISCVLDYHSTKIMGTVCVGIAHCVLST